MPLLPDNLSPGALAGRSRRHAELFLLPLREQNWRGNPGDFAGMGAGSSLDFQDHRQYLAGDDPRHINWQAYARTGDYTLKLYREEVRPVVEIILDVSGSMFTPPDKAARALELFFFAWSASEKAGAATHASLVKGAHWKAVEGQAVHNQHWIEIAGNLPPCPPSAPPDLVSLPLRPRSLRVLISDLLFPSNPETTLRSLQQRSGKAIILCPFDRSESDPDWSGNYEFVDTEDGKRNERRVDPSLLKQYREVYRRHFEGWKAAALRSQAPLARISASGSFEDAIRLEAVATGAIHLA